jgi:2-phospho-L-lactate guanylyltransferase
MRTLITVPMKDPAASKTRLSDSLPDAARARLVRLFYERTLAFLGPVARSTGADIAVVTGSQAAADIARQQSVQVIAEPRNTDLSGAIAAAAQWAEDKHYRRFCVIPADLAAPTEHDLIRFLASPAPVTICPSMDMGTNALLVEPPTAMSFHYGPRSASAHWRRAEERGLRPVLMPLKSLSFDVDTSACLQKAMAVAPELRAVCG